MLILSKRYWLTSMVCGARASINGKPAVPPTMTGTPA